MNPGNLIPLLFLVLLFGALTFRLGQLNPTWPKLWRKP